MSDLDLIYVIWLLLLSNDFPMLDHFQRNTLVHSHSLYVVMDAVFLSGGDVIMTMIVVTIQMNKDVVCPRNYSQSVNHYILLYVVYIHKATHTVTFFNKVIR